MTFPRTTGLLERLFSAPAPRAHSLTAVEPAVPAPAPAPAASRSVTGLVKFRGMLWHPVLGVAEEARLVVTAKVGLPHCARCDKALSLVKGAAEVWSCPGCGDSRPGSDVDFYAADTVIAEDLGAFLRAHPGYAAAEGLPAPARALLT
ncbi:MAG: hypothetical protein SF051_13185 [Elusimicrobiota bacterium]|nr:hypothetical protein [Elusimicrobiota bacterium]